MRFFYRKGIHYLSCPESFATHHLGKSHGAEAQLARTFQKVAARNLLKLLESWFHTF
jgi:hypothetical protein